MTSKNVLTELSVLKQINIYQAVRVLTDLLALSKLHISLR